MPALPLSPPPPSEPPAEAHVLRDDRFYDPDAAAHAKAQIRTWMGRKNLSLASAASEIGVHQSTVSRALSPHGQPSLRILIAVSAKTGLTIGQLLGLQERINSVENRLDGLAREIAALREIREPTPTPVPASTQLRKRAT